MLDRLLAVYLFILVGILLRWATKRSSAVERGLSNLLIYVLVPVVVVAAFEGLLGVEVGVLSELVPATLLMYGFSFLLAFAASRRVKMERGTRGSFLMVNSFPNALYLPFPVVFALFGLDGLAYSSIIFLVSMLIVMFIGFPLSAYHSEENRGVRPAVRRIIEFPGFGAGLVGVVVVLLGIQFPPWLEQPLALVSQGTLYIALIFVGLNLGRSINRRMFESVATAAAIRLAAVPIMMFLFLSVFGSVGLWGAVLLIHSGMPPAVNNIIYAEYFGLDRDLAATVVTSLTVISLVTTPFFVYLGSLL